MKRIKLKQSLIRTYLLVVTLAIPVLSWAQKPDPGMFAEIVAPLIKEPGVAVSIIEKRSPKPHLSLLKRDKRLKNASSYKAYLLDLAVQPSNITSVIAGKQKAGSISLTDARWSRALKIEEGKTTIKKYSSPSIARSKGPLLIFTKPPEKKRADSRLSRQIRLLTGSRILQDRNWVQPASPLSIFRIAAPGKSPSPEELPAEVKDDIQAIFSFSVKADWTGSFEEVAKRLSIKTEYGTELLRSMKPEVRKLAGGDSDNTVRISETAWCS